MFVSRKDKKLVGLQVCSSFRWVAASMLQRISLFISSDSQVNQTERKSGVNMVSLRIQYNITAQLSDWDDCDVIRLVATEHVRNKESFLEFFTLYKITLPFSSIIINRHVQALVTFNQINYIQKVEFF